MFSRARYFTFTGMHADGSPTDVFDRQTELLALHSQFFASRSASDAEKYFNPSFQLLASDNELIAKARQAQNGSKFERLWNGQWEALPDSLRPVAGNVTFRNAAHCSWPWPAGSSRDPSGVNSCDGIG